jgi:zinc/manganese transport system substrate-binding protein
LNHADLLIVAGLGLDAGWLTGSVHVPSAISQSRNPNIQPGAAGYFDASQFAEILDRPSSPLVPTLHLAGNPHYWLDPENGRRIAKALADKLTELRPDDAAYFGDHLNDFDKRLSDAEQAWNAKIRPYRGRKVVTYRRSWSNFLKYFQLVSAGEIEPSPGIPPSGRHTKDLVNLMKSEDVKVILVEPYFGLKTANAIASETGAKVVVTAPSVESEPGAADYFHLFDYNLEMLIRAFDETQ